MDPSWYLYLGIFLGPFVQEDGAVLTAATLSAADPQHFPVVFFIILAGLFASDIWKYWIGYAAHAHPRARRFAEKDKVIRLQDRVKDNVLLTLFTARFVPLARVPAYVACGYFKVPYVKFCATVFLTALLYTIVIFAACHLLGEIFGDRIEMMLPGFALIIVIVAGAVYAWRKFRRPS